MAKINEFNSSGNIELKRELGLAAAVAIVVGNCIGSGIFTSAASLAAASNPKTAILAWIITSAGSLMNRWSYCLYKSCLWRFCRVSYCLDILDRSLGRKRGYHHCIYALFHLFCPWCGHSNSCFLNYFRGIMVFHYHKYYGC